MRHANAHREIVKFPSTPHVSGSVLQPGDDARGQTSIRDIIRSFPDAVAHYSEKVDGANCAISFTSDLDQVLQSRGHVLAGGARESQFSLFKQWAICHENRLMDALEDRYIVYGDWCFSRHTMFYDALPHYFIAFDVFDMHDQCFLDSRIRARIIQDAGITAAPKLFECSVSQMVDPVSLMRPSAFRSDTWHENLMLAREAAGVYPQDESEPDDSSDLSEGVYIKIENKGQVVGRFKYVRPGFRQAIERSNIRNTLEYGIDIMNIPAGKTDIQEDISP